MSTTPIYEITIQIHPNCEEYCDGCEHMFVGAGPRDIFCQALGCRILKRKDGAMERNIYERPAACRDSQSALQKLKSPKYTVCTGSAAPWDPNVCITPAMARVGT